MSRPAAVVVVGACGPERVQYADRLAARIDWPRIPSPHLVVFADPTDEALRRAHAGGADVVIDLPSLVSAPDVLGSFAEPDGAVDLVELICIADAAHLLHDLRRDDWVRTGGPDDDTVSARALLTVAQIEHASTVVLVGWEALPTPDLSLIMALVSHLSPRARLRLDRGPADDAPLVPMPPTPRPGWVDVLNGEFDPHMTDIRVSALRYEQVRPVHPERLRRLLDRMDAGEFGSVLRSAGFCRLATRPSRCGHWDHVGHMFTLAPLAADGDLTDDEELLAVGQELAIIGLDLRHDALRSALDETALSDVELAAGPAGWAWFSDPFPVWASASEPAD